MKKQYILAFLAVLGAAALFAHLNILGTGDLPSDAPKAVDAADAYGKLPIHFEPNVGQIGGSADFVARGRGYSLYLASGEAAVDLEGGSEADSATVRLSLPGRKQPLPPAAMDQKAGRTNYLIGNDPKAWKTDVANYGRVRYAGIYDGISIDYYGSGRQLEYDMLVEPNADPGQIRLRFDGVDSARIDGSGDLLLETSAGTLRQHRPISFQNIAGGRRDVASSYRIAASEARSVEVEIALGEYDSTEPLTIDPILSYGTYLGGNAFDEGRAITVDAAGNAYVVGTSASRNFPTTPGTVKPEMLQSTQANQFYYDAFVTKLDPTGTQIVFSTYFGGRNNHETGSGVAVDADGNVIIGGSTMSDDLPVVNAYQSTRGAADDAFAAKLNASGSAIIYSTYLAGNNSDLGPRVALDSTGAAIFAGTTSSPNFPTTPGAYKQRLCSTPADCSGIFYSGSYVVKLAANGMAVFSTLFDAALNDVARDSANNVMVAGSSNTANFPTTAGVYQPASSGGIDGLLAKLNSTGTSLLMATYLGGGLQSDRITGIAVDGQDNVYMTGRTQNTAFPTTPGAYDQTFNGGEDAFVAKFNPSASSLLISTFFGGTGNDQPFALKLGSAGDIFIAGETTSAASFPLRNSLNGTSGSIFASRFDPSASTLTYSTYLGIGGGYGLATDAANNAYVTGQTKGLIVTPNAPQTVRNRDETNITDKDAFIVKLGSTDENATTYSISGTITTENLGTQNVYWPIVVTLTGSANRSVLVPYSGGPYYFGALPAGGSYTVTVRQTGFVATPENAVFNNLGANQFADFTILRNQMPEGVVTSPAHGTNFNFPAPIPITATATDPDGDAIAKVDFYAYNSDVGGVFLGTDTTAPYEFTWTGATVGTWAISALPTDSKGLRGYSTPTVHINVLDPAAPAVAITSPADQQHFVEGQNVPLAVSVSSSVRLVEIRDQTNTLVGRMTQSPWTTTWRVMQRGTYTLTATAYDAQNNSATSAPVSMIVDPINHRVSGKVIDSITNTGVPNITISLTSPSNPNITATAVTDAAGDYSFTNLGTTPDDGVVMVPSAPGYSFNPPSRSIGYLGYVEHWQNNVFVATRATNISVALTSPTNGQTFTAPAVIDFAADASTTSGSITKVEFYRGPSFQTLLGTDTTAPYTFQWTGVAAGNYDLFARAYDSTGGVKDSAITTITVNPAVTLIRLQGDVTNSQGGYMPGITVLLTGTKPDGTPISLSSVSNYFGAYGFFNLQAGGNYTIAPQAGGGMTYTPPSYSFPNAVADNYDVDFVASGVNQPPTVQISSPTDGAVFTMPATIQFTASASDPDGQVSRLTVTANSRTRSYTIGQTLGGTFSAPWQPTEAGAYTVYASAIDNGGLRTDVSIQITVNPPSPVTIGGRIVDRNSSGIEGVSLTLRDTSDDTVVATAATDAAGYYSIPSLTTFRSYVLTAAKDDFTFAPQRRFFYNLTASQANADFTGTQQTVPSDFDGDGKSDVAVWRPSTGDWHAMMSGNNAYSAIHFGSGGSNDKVVPGNYDGDKKVDYAIYRGGSWFILQSSTRQVRAVGFGLATDIPVPADFDGDGRTDIAVWRPSNGVWYILRSSNGAYDFRQFGTNGDVPVAGDYDGDGMADLNVFRPSGGDWYTSFSSDGGFRGLHFGASGDVPVTGDFDGDKQADIAIYRPQVGGWFVLRSSDNGLTVFQWGVASDKLVPGDYDHDGKTDFAVYRPSEGYWYIYRSGNGTYSAQAFGTSEDIPIPSAFVR